jgi:hypothetical protein
MLVLQEQWLSSDISVEGIMERGVLPPNLASAPKVLIPLGRYPVQVIFESHSHIITGSMSHQIGFLNLNSRPLYTGNRIYLAIYNFK